VLPTTAAALAAAALGGSAPPEPPQGTLPPRQAVDTNPCLPPFAKAFRCPDLVMRQPHGLYLEYRGGETLLRAGNSIDNIGRGPAEFHGVRIGPRFMRARQRIYTRKGRKRISVRTGARLQFKLAHQGRHWWKWYNAARFELWRVDARGRRTRRVRVGAKVAYCLRDLRRTRPRVPRSPPRVVYPACDTYPARQRITLGTSPGWSDIYPPTYPEQWINVSGLRGCFAYVHIADPKNVLYEASEDNNEAQVIVRLPYRSGARRLGCRGRDRGRPLYPSGPY
jgi:hypothetical protein